MTIYLSFLVPKITAIVPTKARPTPSAWNHEYNRVSDFFPIASLLEWQWCQIVINFTTLDRASWTTQCQEIPHSLPEPFYQVLQAQVGEARHSPPHPSLISFVISQVQQILERPSKGGRLHPNADTKLSC